MSDQSAIIKTADRKWVTVTINILIICILAGFIIWGILTYFNLNDDVYTDDAQVEEYINPVNARVSGYIKTVHFFEHMPVKKGDTLVVIDDRELKIQYESAKAAYLSAKASRGLSTSSVITVGSNVGTAGANIAAAEARLLNAKKNMDRFSNLLGEGAATQQQFDQVKSDYDALLAGKRALVQQQLTAHFSTHESEKKVFINDAEIQRAQAAMDMAKLNLSYTVITAPYNGVAGRRSVQDGQLIQAGQTLLSFVKNDDKWIIANYLETQVSRLKEGMKVRLKIDGLSGEEFKGKIVAISEATGARYSSVPLDNSSGNFVKVNQRIPVRIELVDKSVGQLMKLRAGMNVQVELDN